jgi:hypothetical protein
MAITVISYGDVRRFNEARAIEIAKNNPHDTITELAARLTFAGVLPPSGRSGQPWSHIAVSRLRAKIAKQQ